MGSQVIVNGEVLGNMSAKDYYAFKKNLRPKILEAYEKLASEYDIIVIEGAGSPAEINLKENDIVNMGMAKIAKAPVLLAGDMNSRPTEKPQMELKRHFTALNDTTAYTFPADRPDYCIDYIYGYTVNGYDFKVLQQSVLPESVASDHRPVQVDVQVLKK